MNNIYSVTFTGPDGEDHVIRVLQQSVVRAVRFALVFHRAVKIKDVQFLKSIEDAL